MLWVFIVSIRLLISHLKFSFYGVLGCILLLVPGA